MMRREGLASLAICKQYIGRFWASALSLKNVGLE